VRWIIRHEGLAVVYASVVVKFELGDFVDGELQGHFALDSASRVARPKVLCRGRRLDWTRLMREQIEQVLFVVDDRVGRFQFDFM
jgi:hypothetical protein